MKSVELQIFRAKLRGEGILPPKQRQNLIPLCYSGWEEFRWYCPTTRCFASESCFIACLLLDQSPLLCLCLKYNSYQYVVCLRARPRSWTKRDTHPLLSTMLILHSSYLAPFSRASPKSTTEKPNLLTDFHPLGLASKTWRMHLSSISNWIPALLQSPLLYTGMLP